MALTDTDAPELASILIRLPQSNTRFDHFLSYQCNQEFLTPCAAFSFAIDEDELSANDKNVLVVGATVEVAVNDHRQITGIIDAIHVRSGAGGTVWTIEGRDWLSPALDAHIDPQVNFDPTLTLQGFLTQVFQPFGVTAIAADNFANVNIQTGRVIGDRTAKSGTILASALAHQLKPYPNEGAFQFASRIANRMGVFLWGAQDGTTLQAGVPNFDQPLAYQLRHKQGATAGGANNILDGSMTLNRRDQPSCIVGWGVGGGGVFAKTQLRAVVVNVLVNANIGAILDKYPSAVPVPLPDVVAATPGLAGTFVDANARPLYLYDSESHNIGELSHFLLRELSHKMQGALRADYTIMGHRLGGKPVTIDTIVGVEDDRSNLHMPMWVSGRHFSKTPGQGTQTRISLLRPGCLFL